jgi:hypothetical protein
MMEAQDEDSYLRGEQEDKQHQDTVEDPGSEIHLSTGSDRSCNANGQVTVDEDDDDEELRPAKRRKRDLVHPTRPHQPPTPPDNSLEAPLRQPRSATTSSTTQLEDNST